MDFLIIKNFICVQKFLQDDPPVKKIDFLSMWWKKKKIKNENF